MTTELLDAITIVIPTFNRRERLRNALESVLQETRVAIKVHVFDNASTDNTEDYVRSAAALDPRVFYFRNSHNRGALDNYRQALASVDTPYYIPLADDDWLLPNFVFDAFRILEASPKAGAAIFVTEARNESGEIHATFPGERDKIRFGLLEPREHLRDWMSFGHYGWSSILWRSETLKCIGAPYLHVGMASDVDFQAQIFCEFPVYLRNQSGAVYLQHQGQASRRVNISNIREWASAFARLDERVDSLNIFGRNEYLKLRQLMQRRYRWAWNSPAESPLSDQQIVTTALLAAFQLGDWDLAFALLDQLDVTLSTASDTDQLYSLDGRITLPLDGDGNLRESFRGGESFLLSVMLSLKGGKASNTALTVRCESAERELESIRRDLDRLRRELDGMRRNRLVRLIARFGLVRFGGR